MITVLHLLSDRNLGGAGMLTRLLLRHTDRKSFRSHLLLPKGAALSALCAEEGLCYTEIDGAPRAPFLFSALLRAIERMRPDIVVAHAAPSGKLAARLCRVPLVVGVKHCDTPMRGRFLYRRLTDLTVATSHPCGERLARAALPYAVIENGYHPIPPPTPLEREAARAAFGIRQGELAVGLVGRLAPVKNHAVAIRALSLCRTALPEARLHLLGEGEERAALAALSRECGLDGRVVFHGHHPAPTSFYHAIDIHLSCSEASETSSLSLAEGMSAACATVASDIAGNRARVGAGGLLFPPQSEAALCAHLLLLRDPTVRGEMGRRALARARELPTAAQMTAAYEQLFLRFLEKKRRKPHSFSI